MTLPYRTRRFLRGLAAVALVLVLLLIAVWLVWLLWLDRYVVYTRDGAVLDFSVSDKEISGQVAVPPEDDLPISIYYNEGDNILNISTEMTQMYGYYISTSMLENEMDTIMTQLRKLPSQTPVLVEVKDIAGRFYYATDLGPVRAGVDTAAVEQLFSYLKLSDLYAIAKFPALRDYNYGLNHVSDGIFLRSGMGLWLDDSRCYWLNPNSQGTRNYLTQIITEPKQKGFNEVVLGDYTVPVSDKLKFTENRQESLLNTANTLIQSCGSDRFGISFCVTDPAFPLPEGRTRLYLENRPASEIKTTAEQVTFDDPTVRLVFITPLNDTRFDEYSVLRPLNTAQLDEQK
jgi:hypothetical protein